MLVLDFLRLSHFNFSMLIQVEPRAPKLLGMMVRSSDVATEKYLPSRSSSPFSIRAGDVDDHCLHVSCTEANWSKESWFVGG